MRHTAHEFEPYPEGRSPDSCMYCGRRKDYYLHTLRSWMTRLFKTHEWRDGKMVPIKNKSHG